MPKKDQKCENCGCHASPSLQPTKSECQQHLHFEHKPAHGEILVIMRYKREMDRRIRNCIIRLKGRIRQYGPGVCLGIAEKVDVIESTECSDWGTRNDWCIAMFLFPNEKQANLWYISEPELKQHDFLPPYSGVQLFSLRLRYLPEPGRLTFHWMELHNVLSNTYLQKEFVDKVAALFDQHSINHGVAFIQNPGAQGEMNRMKDAWLPYNAHAYCVLNVFESEDQFYSIYNSDKYRQLQAKQGQACETLSLLFTLDPEVSS